MTTLHCDACDCLIADENDVYKMRDSGDEVVALCEKCYEEAMVAGGGIYGEMLVEQERRDRAERFAEMCDEAHDRRRDDELLKSWEQTK